MPHLAHSRVPVASRSPSPSPVTPRPDPQQRRSSERAISRKAWPPFPPAQSLSDDTAQLHLTLRSPPPSHSPSPAPSPHLSRRPSSSGSATPESDNPVLVTVAESLDPGNGSLASPFGAHLTDKHRFKKNNRLSASSLASRLSANHEEKRERKERKRTEKVLRHEQALQELRTAERRRAYFRDASHRQELVFGPEVRAFFPTLRRVSLTFVPYQDVFTVDFCYGFLQFSPTLSLQLPGGISFDLMHYWDGQPVRFVCCERRRGGNGDSESKEGDADSDVPWGRVLWCVAIELVPDEEPQPPPHARPGSRTANGATNGVRGHHQGGDGDGAQGRGN